VSAHAGRSLGRYRLEDLLGQGGMAEVYRATDTKLARTVAVKVILATHAAEEHFLERFLREARMVASLEHPNILPVYDFGEENGVPFLVMPYLSGGTLRERLRAGAAPLALASVWIVELADALDAAHAAGVLHRDVKPANVLVGKNDRLFLADFGIAKMLESQSGLTATGVVVGTPIYMAPEQAQGRPASPATDRYALAVRASEILCGRPPFEGDSALSLMHQHVSSPPPPLSARIGGLPAGLDALFSQALAKDPAARPPTCRAFADAVAALTPAGITPPPSLAGRGAAPGSTTSPTIHSTPDPRQVTVAPRTTPGAPPSTPPTVRLSGARPSLTSEATVLMGSRGKARRAVALGAVALAVLAGAWWIAAHRPARESVLPLPPAAVPPVPTVPAASASAPASVAVLEKAEKTPEPAPVTGKTEPLARKLADEEKRIAQLEARVKEAEAAAREAQAARAPPAVAAAKPPPPPPPLEAGRPEVGQPAARGEAVSRLIAVRERLEPGRRHARRLSREDFQFALDEARVVLQQYPRNPDARYLVTYGRGGLAYVAGKDALASALLVEAFTELRRTAKHDVRLIVGLLLRPDGTIGQPAAWELALGFGDARGEAMGLIEKELAANPRSVRALKARAQLRKMQGLDEGQPN
jgi:serine/threonine protein kinase